MESSVDNQKVKVISKEVFEALNIKPEDNKQVINYIEDVCFAAILNESFKLKQVITIPYRRVIENIYTVICKGNNNTEWSARLNLLSTQILLCALLLTDNYNRLIIRRNYSFKHDDPDFKIFNSLLSRFYGLNMVNVHAQLSIEPIFYSKDAFMVILNKKEEC